LHRYGETPGPITKKLTAKKERRRDKKMEDEDFECEECGEPMDADEWQCPICGTEY
jgi:rubrerythrin